MKIIFDKNNCIGCGTCNALCPKYWDMSDEAKAILKGSKETNEPGIFELEVKNLTEEDAKCNKEAADSCPVQVIKIE